MKIPARIAALVLAGVGLPLAAQMPQSLPGIPMTAPPVDHPALSQQPLIPTNTNTNSNSNSDQPTPMPAGSDPAMPAGKKSVDPAVKRAAEFRDVRVAGEALEDAVAQVRALDWRKDLLGARATAAATGKAILWVQALGDLEGFA